MEKEQSKVKYRDKLDKPSKDRYDEKIALIGFDPYDMDKDQASKMSSDPDALPEITYYGIVNYLINTKSAYTMEQLNAVKSLESIGHSYVGWVKDVKYQKVEDKMLITGRVRHSQRMNETPLRPWVVASQTGYIHCAHCDCMAGLGEVCSHVGALLFWIDITYRANKELTVTQKKAYWPVPSYIEKVSYDEVKDIDFTSTEKKIKDLDVVLSGDQPPKRTGLKLPEVPEPSEEEIQQLNEKLSKSACKPAVLAVRRQYQDEYVPEILQEGKLPISLHSLREEKYVLMNREDLLAECLQLYEKISVTEEQAKNAEIITKEQRKSKEWYYLRRGRITASNMKTVCQGSVTNPAKSTVKAICGNSKFKNNAMQWGIAKEQEAISKYRKLSASKHEEFKVEKSGFVINPMYPHIGASPDGFVSCLCCGDGLLEVKCPFSVKDKSLGNSEFRVEYLNTDNSLKSSHKYMYQIQTQLLATGRKYCDFVIWTEKECLVQRVLPNVQMFAEIIDKSKVYFLKVILPELTGDLISRQDVQRIGQTPKEPEKDSGSVPCNVLAQVPENKTAQDSQLTICICHQVYDPNNDDVIGCDNENCPYVWLHFQCVNIKHVPKGKYFCPECRKQQPKRKKIK